MSIDARQRFDVRIEGQLTDIDVIFRAGLKPGCTICLSKVLTFCGLHLSVTLCEIKDKEAIGR